MIEAAVLALAAALRDPVTGVAARLGALTDPTGSEGGVALPGVDILDDVTCGWLARGTIPDAATLASGPLLCVSALGSQGGSAEDLGDELPADDCVVRIAYVTRNSDTALAVRQARHVQRAWRAAVASYEQRWLGGFLVVPLPVAPAHVFVPTARGQLVEVHPWGDAIVAGFDDYTLPVADHYAAGF